MYSIYTLSDPRDTNVRYVGLSKNPYQRYGGHLLNTEKKKTTKNLWVMELLEIGAFPILAVIETTETREQAEKREQYWIQHYLLQNANLTNERKVPFTPKKHIPALSGIKTTNLEATKQFISDQGWTPQEKARRNSGNLYLYAARWLKGQTQWRYIGPLSKLEAMTAQEILAKLNRQ